MKPTDYSAALAVKLAALFGQQEAVPPELRDKWFMIHMRLQEAEQEIEQLWQRAAAYQGQPPDHGPAGPETGEF